MLQVLFLLWLVQSAYKLSRSRFVYVLVSLSAGSKVVGRRGIPGFFTPGTLLIVVLRWAGGEYRTDLLPLLDKVFVLP